ncbi:hypothetical protein NESM_000720000 [Novymonas esmeraldas]|uniref:Uncharacterized protein n=1 Tax=Novymonas esmeraldas TaxID=1808958 RepID=A0AAW0EX89_9TRYP
MGAVDADRFLVLSGECPGEGVWCWARTYAELVECVQVAWGGDYRPLFKYKLPCTPSDAAAVPPRRSAEAGETAQESAGGVCASTLRHANPAECLVVLNDVDDFELWRRGGALVSATSSPLAGGAFVHHCDAPAGSAGEIVHVVAEHMDYHRSAAAGEAAQRLWRPRPLTAALYAFHAGHGPGRARPSPPVRRADADVVTTPVRCILDPALLVRLGVAVVLRHSAAPAEVVLFSDQTPTGQGELPWGALCLKAQRAWGVHSPQFRYVDLSRGVTQMLVNHVKDYRAWSRQVRLGNCELLVVEQAPSAARGAVFAQAATQSAIMRYYTDEWPEERCASAPSTNVVNLVRELKSLEREERLAAVARPGRVDNAVVAAAPTPTTLATTATATAAVTEAVQRQQARPAATVAAAAFPSTPAEHTPYRPLLQQQRHARPTTTPTARLAHRRLSSTTTTTTTATTTATTSAAATPSRAAIAARTATDEQLDKEMRRSLLDAEHYSRLMKLLSPGHRAATGATRSAAQGMTPPDSRASTAAGSGGVVTGPSQARQWVFAKKAVAPEADLVATHRHEEHHNTLTGATADAASRVSHPPRAPTAAPARSTPAALTDTTLSDAHARAHAHHKVLSHHFHTHSVHPGVGGTTTRSIGATPVW